MDAQFEERLEEVTKRIVQEYNPQKIVLFGSYAYGQPTSDSDVDMLIIMESDERPITRSAKMSRLLRPRPFPMDILVKTPKEIEHRLTTGDQFIREILSRGRILYER